MRLQVVSDKTTTFDFDAPVQREDGSASVEVRCFIDGVAWGSKTIQITKAEFDAVTQAPAVADVPLAAQIYNGFHALLVSKGIISGAVTVQE